MKHLQKMMTSSDIFAEEKSFSNDLKNLLLTNDVSILGLYVYT